MNASGGTVCILVDPRLDPSRVPPPFINRIRLDVERGSPGCKLKRDFFLVAPGVMSADTTLRLTKVVRSHAGDPDG
jgi:hypothetical protein